MVAGNAGRTTGDESPVAGEKAGWDERSRSAQTAFSPAAALGARRFCLSLFSDLGEGVHLLPHLKNEER
jgi:hypothetical protein